MQDKKRNMQKMPISNKNSAPHEGERCAVFHLPFWKEPTISVAHRNMGST